MGDRQMFPRQTKSTDTGFGGAESGIMRVGWLCLLGVERFKYSAAAVVLLGAIMGCGSVPKIAKAL
jgi:hypothetical protein